MPSALGGLDAVSKYVGMRLWDGGFVRMWRFMGLDMQGCAGIVVTFRVPLFIRFTIADVDGKRERVGEGSILVRSATLSSGDGRLGSLLMVLALVALGGFS